MSYRNIKNINDNDNPYQYLNHDIIINILQFLGDYDFIIKLNYKYANYCITKISDINIDYHKFKNLNTVDLNCHILNKINSHQNVKKIILNQVLFESIPNDFNNFPNLEHLILNNSNIYNIGTIKTITHLEINNSTRPINLYYLPNLTHLKITSCKLRILDYFPSYIEYINLQNTDIIIDIINKPFIKFHQLFYHTKKKSNVLYLKYLNISKTFNIKCLCFLPNLQELYAHHSRLKTIPFFPKLKILDISLTDLYDKYIYRYKKLYTLNISHTSINNIPKCKTLEHLNCSYTKITTLNYLKNTNIISIKCNFTYITSLPYIDSLKELECSDNNIYTIPPYPNLIKLNINKTKIKQLPFLENLKSFECIDTKINKLPSYDIEKLSFTNLSLNIEDIKKLKNLKELNCSSSFFKQCHNLKINHIRISYY